LTTPEYLTRLGIAGTAAWLPVLHTTGTKRLFRFPLLAIAVWLAGCSPERFDRPGNGGDEALYSSLYPYYAEFCALSQIKKKPGFGANIRGEPGGHSVFYLNGACRDAGTDYPVLRVCDPADAGRDDGANVSGAQVGGVGVSMNAHFSNAKWVAIPDRAFFFGGGLPHDHGLTRADYVQAKATAKQMGIYRAVSFQPWVFDAKPADVSREDWKYEVSIATDYAIDFGRGRFCARVPVNRAQMTRIIDFVNAQNAPYRAGTQIFKWSVFQDNCIHLAHNALAAAGVWPEWPINQPLLFAIFDFPVPKNDFVNLVRRIDDPPDLDLEAIYHDATAVRSMAAFGRLPWQPGTVVESHAPRRPNAVYDLDLAMLFYDEPITGRYQARLDAIFRDPRYFDIEQNLGYFAGLYHGLDAGRQPLATWLRRDEFRDPDARSRFTDFYDRFYAYLDRQSAVIDAKLARLSAITTAGALPAPRLQANAQ
jgi:hypothetical protein